MHAADKGRAVPLLPPSGTKQPRAPCLLTCLCPSAPAVAPRSIYTKLVGDRHAGLFQAVLMMLMGVGRIAAGQLVGWAYDSLGPCACMPGPPHFPLPKSTVNNGCSRGGGGAACTGTMTLSCVPSTADKGHTLHTQIVRMSAWSMTKIRRCYA